MKRHEILHLGLKLKCKSCDEVFSTARNLKAHELKHSGEYKLKCSLCEKGFQEPKELEDHYRSYTGEKFNCKL